MTVEEIIETLNLSRHPRGGWFVPSFRAGANPARLDITSIFHLLVADEVLPWRKLTANEIWHHYDGAPVELRVERTRRAKQEVSILGKDLRAGERPQIPIPSYHWQSARSLGEWSLVGCDVAPGFALGQTQIANIGE